MQNIWYFDDNRSSFANQAIKIDWNNHTQRSHDVIITLLLRQNDVAASFWRNIDVVITPCVRWVCTCLYTAVSFLWNAWWQHGVETISTLQVFCEFDQPVTDGFPWKVSVMQSFDVSSLLSWYWPIYPRIFQFQQLNDYIFSCDQAALWMVQSVCLSVCLSVRPSHLFEHVPIIVSSWNFQELLTMTEVTSMKNVKVRGQRSRSQRSTPNLAVSGP